MSLIPVDPNIPWLTDTLDCEQVRPRLESGLGYPLQVTNARLLRHKPGRRALIEYQITTTTQSVVLLGKIRAKGLDQASYTLQKSLWEQGFNAESLDGFSVPEPLGLIPEWHLWLQLKVPGLSASQVLPTPSGLGLMPRISALASKLHASGITPLKIHRSADELQILHDRLSQLAQQCPQWETRLAQILEMCDRITARIESLSLPMTTIHRDYYADQILVDGDRLWLVDLDLACQGHAAVDIGNFIAHITEQSLRQYRDPNRLANREEAVWVAYLAATQSHRHPDSGASMDLPALRMAIAAYTTLSLVRHISISWQMPARQPFTETLLDLSDRRCSEAAEYLRL